ncbi:SLBB domain-containing protein [Amylibacter sp.]|nr:SLBB domain-containing protein [Amylibacter sp.]
MTIRFVKLLLTFILVVSAQPYLAQTLSDGVLESSIFDSQGISKEDIQTYQEKQKTYDINGNIISDNKEVLNTENSNIRFMESSQNQSQKSNISVLRKYFYSLTGELLDVYGESEFKQGQEFNLLFFNIIGRGYQLAPGDVIQVKITGLQSLSDKVQIQSDGTLTLESLAPINVNGLNLDQVSNIILDMIILDDASAKVFVTLKNARLVTVQISGNVNSPRTIAVPAYTPLSRVIAYSGGISQNGSLRNIFLSQPGEKTRNIDFYEFLQNPLPTNDPLIKNNARIFVPNKGPTIAAVGFLGRPGVYELNHNETSMEVSELLKLTGNTFIPPGATLKISYFDQDGKSLSRVVSKKNIINEGEALILDFIETRELNNSQIYGAVLNEYHVTSNEPKSISEVLKGGAVLSSDALTSFALIINRLEDTVEPINLNHALNDDRILLPVGADLKLFSQEEYLSLVNTDPNYSDDIIAAKLTSSNIAEIYVNGIRIAYVAPNSTNSLFGSVSDFYSITPKTVSDFVLIQKSDGIKALSLKKLMTDKNYPSLSRGERLFIFENKFYSDLLQNMRLRSNEMNLNAQNVSNTENNTVDNFETFKLQQEIQKKEDNYLEAINYSRNILQQSNLIQVALDGQLVALLPYKNGITSIEILKELRSRLPKLVNEFAIIQDVNSDLNPMIKNLNYSFDVKNNQELNLISQKAYRSIIKEYELDDEINIIAKAKSGDNIKNLVANIKSSDAVKVYYDGRLELLLSPDYIPKKYKLFEQYYKKSDFYKLYIGLNTKNLDMGTWNFLTYGAEEFFSKASNINLGQSNIVHFFSKDFIRKEFIEKEGMINGVNFNIIANNHTVEPNNGNNNLDGTTDMTVVNDINTNFEIDKNLSDNQVSNNNNLLVNHHIEIMSNSLRKISGSVRFPGSYPVADKINLTDFISTAGLIENTSKSNIQIIQAIKQKDRLVRAKPKVININDSDLKNITLSGIYALDVPLAINDAITGVIELKGEVLRPGNYSFTRAETLSDIIKRAGGISDVSFPLGAVLQRKSLKEQEKETNGILADQMESSILTLAQSSLEDAGGQVQVLLSYANKLRIQPTLGRMTLNILDESLTNPIFLEDGDKLTIPKRPSHVTIVGSVQRTTVAAYKRDKNFYEYLQSAGGATKIADIRKAYLLLPNGESLKLNKSTLIPVGSVIIVPPKLDRLSILGTTDVISRVLGNITDSILSIQNVD